MHIIVCTKALHIGSSGAGELAGLEFSLGNYEKQIFSLCKPIVHFSINAAALSTLKRHVPACQMPVTIVSVEVNISIYCYSANIRIYL